MRIASILLTATAAFMPSAALAAPRLNLTTVFFDAALSMKLLMLALILFSVAAVVITVGKLARGRRLSGGSAFISGLRMGGPLIGLLGAAFVLLQMFIGIANSQADVPMPILAPGLAEAAFLILLGLMAGAVAVICNWAIEARIDRTVLQS